MNPAELVRAASETLENAYAPYSQFRVGAALLCTDGTVFTGCNVENASYGLTNCAERTAVFSAIAAGHLEFEALAVVADGDALPYPCGACRQVLAEFCDPHLSIYLARINNPGTCETTILGELLPHSFRL